MPDYKRGHDKPMPIGMDNDGLAHPLRTDADGRLELVLASGGAYRQMVSYFVGGVLAAGSGVQNFPNALAGTVTIQRVYLAVNTAPVGQAIIVDVHKNGTTIFTDQNHRPQIAAAAYNGYTDTIDVPTWEVGEALTIDIDQVGTVTKGSHLTVTVVYG